MKKNVNTIALCAFGLLLSAPVAGYASATGPDTPMTKSDVKELVGKAKTAEDHRRLAAYFSQDAEKMEAEAAEHEDLAKEYARNPTGAEMKHPMSGSTAAHCRYFAQAARKAAAEDRALAAAHEEMAKKAEESK